MNIKAQEKSTYFSVLHITSSVFVDVEVDTNKKGRVLLFMFFISKSKEQAVIDESKQDSIKIIQGKNLKESAFLCMNNLDYPTWGASFEDISKKSNFFITTKLLPENFWEMDPVFKARLYEKIVSSALSETTELNVASTNTLSIEVLLDFAQKTKDTVYMRKIKDFEKVRTYGCHVSGSKKKKNTS